MRSLRQRLTSSGTWQQPLFAAVLASLIYTGVVFSYGLQPSSEVTFTGSVWHAFGLYSLMAFGTVGVPVLLWVRYRIRGPLGLAALVVLFWHVLIYVPPIGSGQGDSPGFLFVFVFAPFYLVAYGLLAGGEYWLRGRNFSMGLRET